MRIRVEFTAQADDGQDADEIVSAVTQLLWDIDAMPDKVIEWEPVDGGEEES